jgi:hypothetical protein
MTDILKRLRRWAQIDDQRHGPGGIMIERGNWLVEGIEEWSQFLGGCNWYTFHPIKAEIEDDRIMGGVEVTIIILGVGFRWRWNHTVTEAMADALKSVDDIESGRVKIDDIPRL